MLAKEDFISFRGYRIWYRIVYSQKKSFKLPLLCLHGGPGFTWDSFEPLEAITATGRDIIFYDQLGCGNSDDPHNPSMYTVSLYVDEVGVVRHALGLDHVHILGHSWGGMLAMEYALTQPPGLASLILTDTGASTPQWVAEMRRLVSELPIEVQQTIQKHESSGTTDSSEYQEACMIYSRRHGSYRLDPRPACLNRIADKPGEEVFRTMWGPSEWCATGLLKDWDITKRLYEIHVPALVIGGRFDEATPTVTETVYRGIPGSEWVIFENSGHFPYLEETESYLRLLSQFLDRVEAKLK
jgi:proline-specific peptidase